MTLFMPVILSECKSVNRAIASATLRSERQHTESRNTLIAFPEQNEVPRQ
jgi:hypothetical protein